MRILLIKPKHIGDTLVLTPTITALKQAHPKAKIWVVVRRGCEGILAGCPEIDRVLTVTAVDKAERRRGDFLRDFATLLRLWTVAFDYIFELGDGHRARFFAMACRAKRRYSVKPASPLKAFEQRRFTALSSFDWESCHRVEKDFFSVAEFLPLSQPIPPLRFDRCLARSWEPAEKLTDFCVMQIGKRQPLSRWQREGWEEVARALLKKVGTIVVTSGASDYEIEEAIWLQDRLGPRVFCTLGRADWPQVAGLLYRARLYVGLDTATMHLAAACGCPVVALFGPTFELHWRPWQAPHRIVTSANITFTGDAREDFLRVKQRSMADIRACEVIAACQELLEKTGNVLVRPAE